MGAPRRHFGIFFHRFSQAQKDTRNIPVVAVNSTLSRVFFRDDKFERKQHLRTQSTQMTMLLYTNGSK
uniref:Uncharacterized protein n=1 Tax=Anopheles aquasalis TaxID=42839 RepID=T1DP81_ANOAQ